MVKQVEKSLEMNKNPVQLTGYEEFDKYENLRPEIGRKVPIK